VIFNEPVAGGTRLSVKVQIVSTPDRMVRFCTPLLMGPVCAGGASGVPVPAVGLDWITHEAESSFHPLGTASFRSRVVVGAYGISVTEPLPLIVQLLTPFLEAAEALNVNAVVSLGFAVLTIVRKPLPGVTTQSNGLLFPSFPADG
jgi:hypothetical protein